MNARSQLTTPLVCRATSLDDTTTCEMFALYERYYACASYPRFTTDLANKNYALLLRDESGSLQGFSTLAVYERAFAGENIRVMFSGDTVVDEHYWGQQALAFSWLRLAGEIKAEQPHKRLYWLLISKGHRTYRYLSAFSHEFHPAPERVMPQRISELIAFLAYDRFGDAYDQTTGVLHFPRSLGHLREPYALISETHQRLPEVAFFLARNPGFAQGDELVCLCELSAENLRPIARRAFLGRKT